MEFMESVLWGGMCALNCTLCRVSLLMEDLLRKFGFTCYVLCSVFWILQSESLWGHLYSLMSCGVLFPPVSFHLRSHRVILQGLCYKYNFDLYNDLWLGWFALYRSFKVLFVSWINMVGFLCVVWCHILGIILLHDLVWISLLSRVVQN